MKYTLVIPAFAAIVLASCTAESEQRDNGVSDGQPAASTGDDSSVRFDQMAGEAAAGEAVFARCLQCHAIQPGVNRTGPSLHGVVGRPAASVGTFNYSPAMTNSGLTWDEETLFRYLENPQEMVRGSRMIFTGIPDAQERADLIAFLGTLNQ